MTNGTGDNRSTTEYVSFDILGRVTRSKQTTDNVVYGDDANPMTYTYNLSGALIEQRYPSGRVVKNVLDGDGELATVQSKKNANNAFWNYANHFTYNAAGAVTSMQLGNGRWESTKFNERLQPTQIALGKTAPVVSGQQVTNSTELLKLEYQYGDLDWDGTVLTGTNNGNVAKQTITVESVGATPGFTAVQNYDYDSVNRIQIASETLTPTTGTPETWTQDFRYDRYGNRKFNEQTTTTLPRECGTAPNFTVCPNDPKINPSANPNDNKLAGYSFDAVGNTIRDAENRKFTYDAENKQTKVQKVDANGNPIARVGEYVYDGDGRRVKKKTYENDVLTEETIFVYDASGKLIGEYSNEVASAQDAKVAYLTNDHLGSPRINTDVNGNVITRHDYHPFGEEIASSHRTVDLGYGDDKVRKQFTGYERDNESELDFAEARYLVSGYGRFTSPDPLLESGQPSSPQTFNRYVYVGNNPLFWVDPTGLIWGKNDQNQVRWFDNKLGKGFSEFKPENGQYVGTGSRIIQLDPNSSNWAYVNPVEVRAVSNPGQDLALGLTQGIDNAVAGMETGAANFAIGTVNSFSNPLGPAGAAAGVPNPFAIHPYAYANESQASYGSATGAGLTVGMIAAGGVFSDTGSVQSITGEFNLLYRAENARDAAMIEDGRDFATYIGGYTNEGRIAVGRSSNPVGCAEDDVARQLGSSAKFTEAYGWRGGMNKTLIAPCARCQQTYSASQLFGH